MLYDTIYVRKKVGFDYDNKILIDTVRFETPGTFYWTVPPLCIFVDVFLVGAGGGGFICAGGGGGYTMTYRGVNYIAPTTGTWQILSGNQATGEGRNGNGIDVVPAEIIEIIVGTGGTGGIINGITVNQYPTDGGFSQFKDSTYRAEGGKQAWIYQSVYYVGGNGGSSGGMLFANTSARNAGSNGSNGVTLGSGTINSDIIHESQGNTTRDFGVSTGGRNAGGGSLAKVQGTQPGTLGGGASDYTQNKGDNANSTGGGGYGGGGAGSYSASQHTSGNGGAGTVLINCYR